MLIHEAMLYQKGTNKKSLVPGFHHYATKKSEKVKKIKEEELGRG